MSEISRRELIRRAGGLVTLAALGGILAACGNAGQPTAATTGTAAAAGTPVRGGKLTIAITANITSIDPIKEWDWTSMSALNNMFDAFLTLDNNNQRRPLLATSWEATPDGKRFTFHLRQGVKFHDGTEFNAAAVQATMEQLLDPKNKAPQKPLYDNMASMETPDPYTFVFNWKVPTVIDDFFTNMLWSPFICSPAAMADMAKFDQHPVGAGPFQFKEYVADDHVTLTRFDGYWGGAPYLDEVVIRIIPDQSTRRSEMLSGDVDVYIGVPPSDVSALQQAGIVVLHGPQPGQQMLSLNLANPVLADLSVRKAIAYAIDKQAIVQKVFYGLADVGTTLVHPNSPGFAKDIPGYGYDPAQAKQILAADGWVAGSDGVLQKNGQRLELNMPTRNDATWLLVCQIIQQELQQIGIKVNISESDWATFLANMRAGKYDIAYWSLGGNSFQSFHYTANLLSTAYWNVSQITKNPALKGLSQQLDDLINSAQAELDDQKREQIMHRFQQLIVDQLPVIPLWHTQNVEAMQKWVHGLEHPSMIPVVRCEKAWVSPH